MVPLLLHFKRPMETKKHTTRRDGNCVITDNKALPYTIIRPDTKEEWLKQRTMGIGASECGKAIGCSKYGTSYSLFMDKIGENKPIEENWAMRQGHIFERVVAEEFQSQTGYKVLGINQVGVVKNDWLACSREHDYLRVSPDYLYWLQDKNGKDLAHNLRNRGILECKTSVVHYTPECLANECLSWYCQVQYQLYVLGLQHAYLGFLCTDSLNGGEFWFSPIEYNAKFCTGTLIPALVDLWEHHIDPARTAIAAGDKDLAMSYAPELTSADDVVRRYPKADPSKSINGDDVPDFFDRLAIYINNRVEIKKLEAKQKDFEDYCKLAMKDAECIVGSDQRALVTFKSSSASKKFDSTRFKSECPDMYDQYCTEQPGTRRFIIK